MVFRPAGVATSAALIAAGRAAAPAVRWQPGHSPSLDPKAISYYPATGGWTSMWGIRIPARCRTELGRIAALGATTVRIIVPASYFGFPQPAEPYVGRLRELVGSPALPGLAVQLTLFGWLHENGYADIAGLQQWARDASRAVRRRPAASSSSRGAQRARPERPAGGCLGPHLIPYVQSAAPRRRPGDGLGGRARPDAAKRGRAQGRAGRCGAGLLHDPLLRRGRRPGLLDAARRAAGVSCRAALARRDRLPHLGARLRLLRGALERAGAGGGAEALPADGGVRRAGARDAAAGRVDAQRLRRRHDPGGRGVQKDPEYDSASSARTEARSRRLPSCAASSPACLR